jgi:ABC-2 type transport system permease protein
VSNLLLAEAVKIRSVRTFLWVGLANVGLLLATAFSFGASEGMTDAASDDRAAAQFAAVSVVFALIAGIMIMAGEATHGTITQALLVTPERQRVVAAKAIAAAVVGFLLAVVSEAIVLLILVPGVSLDLGNARPVLIGILVGAPLAGVVGVGFGAAVHAQGAAIAMSLIWLLIGENIASLVLRDSARFTPGRAFAALTSGDPNGTDQLLSVSAGSVVAVAWTAAFLAVGVLALAGRDI